jgi:hypothetical protein
MIVIVTYGGLIIQHQRYRPYDSNSDLWGTNNPTSTKHTHKTKDRVTAKLYAYVVHIIIYQLCLKIEIWFTSDHQ